MKTKYILSILIVGLSLNTLNAQNKNVASARLIYQDVTALMQGKKIPEIDAESLVKIKAKLAKAVEYIEPATTNEKTSIKEKTWRYRGDIYQLISLFGNVGDVISVAPDAISRGSESYIKAMEIDKKGSYNTENKQGLSVMENIAVNDGINKYNADDFSGAYKSFDNANLMAEKMGITDTTAMQNAALSANRASMYQEAADYYQKCIDLNIKEDGLYKSLYDSYVKMGKKDEAFQILQDGIKKNPNDQGLVIDLINVYLENDELEKAMTYLEASVANDPNNAVLIYSTGSVYDNLGKKQEARDAYTKALTIDPNYFEANYNLGASYYNEAAVVIKEVNLLGLNQTKQITEGTEKAKGLFNQALPYLERAYEINPNDASTVQSLKEVYVRLNMTDKYKALNKK